MLGNGAGVNWRSRLGLPNSIEFCIIHKNSRYTAAAGSRIICRAGSTGFGTKFVVQVVKLMSSKLQRAPARSRTQNRVADDSAN